MSTYTLPRVGAVEMAGYSFVSCRELRHAWEYGQTRRDGDVVHRELVCLRCDTLRVERFTFEPDGHLRKSGNRYVYTDGYSLKGTQAPEVAQAARLYSVLARLGGR